MPLGSYEVNRNWQVKAESAFAAALKVAIEEGGAIESYAYSVVDMSTGEVAKVRLGRDPNLEVAICPAVMLPGGKFVRISKSDTPMEGTQIRWLVFPAIPGVVSMMSMAENFRDRSRAISRARNIGSMICAARSAVLH